MKLTPASWLLSLALILSPNLPLQAATPASAPAKPMILRTTPPPQRVTSVEGITEYRLSNGLSVLLFPDPSVQTITVNINYLVGSRNENYGEKGMAHLLEHMMFKGTPTHRNIPKELSDHGARANATTWLDRTHYFETFPAGDANLDWALGLESDRMVNSYIARKDLDSEMTVVRNEFESGENNPANILRQRVTSTAFLWHNYGHSTIGARSDIEKVPIGTLQGFYHRYYRPDNAILLVGGNIDEAKTLARIQQMFGSIPRPPQPLVKTYTEEPAQDGERSVTLRRVGDVQDVLAAYHIPAGSSPQFAAVDVLSEILGDTPSGRLYKALVETHKATGVGGGAYQLREPGVAMYSAEVRQGDSLEAARDILLETVEGVGSRPVTAEEVDRARTSLLKQIELNLNSSTKIGLELSEWEAMGDWRLLFLYRDTLKKLTVADVQQVATAYLKPSNRTLGMFVPTAKPDRAQIPPPPDVAALVKDYKGNKPVDAGEAFDPSPANIEHRAVRRDLPGGLHLVVLPKRTRGHVVQVLMRFHIGNEKSLAGQSTASSLTGAMLMRGTLKHTRQELQDALDKNKARVGVGGSGSTVSASIDTTAENLPATLQLVAEILRQPSFPDKEFESLKLERLASIESIKSEPQTLTRLGLERHLQSYPADDIRYTATLDEEIARLKAATLDDVRKFYQGFYGASSGEISVVGDVDPAAFADQVQKLLGDWKSPQTFAHIPRVFQDVPVEHQSFETPEKANATYLATIPMSMRDDDPDFPALTLANYMMGGGFLNSRLATRIRQKEGISYGVNSGLSVPSLDHYATFTIYAIYAPENVKRLEVAVQEELARALKDGFTKDEVTAAKLGFLQSRQVDRANDGSLLSRLASYRYVNRTLAWDADLEKKIDALTPDAILAAMRRHIDPAKLNVYKAGDFAKSASKP